MVLPLSAHPTMMQVHQVVRAAEAKISQFQEAAEETRLELVALQR